MSEADDERVGYGRPPRHSRFKPGQSGNPSGKTKGVRSLKADLAEELSQTVQVSENGRTMVLSKQRLALKALTSKAIKGHTPAAAKLFELVRDSLGYGDDSASGSGRLGSDDEAVIAAFLAQRDQDGSDG